MEFQVSASWNTRVLLAATLFFFAVAGCSSDGMSPGRSTVSMTPSNGATEVRLDSPILLSFGGSVERGIVERSFRLLSERSMNDLSALPTPLAWATWTV
jgi:hypothetical protein